MREEILDRTRLGCQQRRAGRLTFRCSHTSLCCSQIRRFAVLKLVRQEEDVGAEPLGGDSARHKKRSVVSVETSVRNHRPQAVTVLPNAQDSVGWNTAVQANPSLC